MERLGIKLASSINEYCAAENINMHIAQMGGMFTPFFRKAPVNDLTEAKDCDTDRHARFFHDMLDKGIYLPPSQFETAFISAAHTENDIDALVTGIIQAISA